MWWDYTPHFHRSASLAVRPQKKKLLAMIDFCLRLRMSK